MKRLLNLWIYGWSVFGKYLYFTLISTILFVPIKLILVALSAYTIDYKLIHTIIEFGFLIIFAPFICYLTFKITKLLGKQITFPFLCPKCGSFIERKDAENLTKSTGQ